MKLNDIVSTIKQHWVLIIILVIATWFRTYDLQQRAIFFGDAAHDLLEARTAVQTGQLPLLGIASSVPRFKQGPLTVWLEMIIYLVAETDLYIYSLVFAVISIAAVIAVYEYATLHISERVGVLSSLLIATSPLAIAQGRMVYHTNPIPLMLVIYFFGLMQLWQKRRWGFLIAGLTWALLFQFELALLPLLLLIPYVIWRTQDLRHLQRQQVFELGAGLILGLLPQIVFDLTHNFAQLGGFVVWLGYRILSAVGIVGDHIVSGQSLSRGLGSFWLYLGRVVSVDQTWLKGLVLGLWLVALIYAVKQLLKRRLNPGMELVTLATLLLGIGFLIHSAPSEAYFPPFIILMPLVMANLVFNLRPSLAKVVIVLLVGVSLFNLQQVVKSGFFVSQDQAFNYGPSTGEQRQIINYMSQVSGENFAFNSTDAGGIFPSYLDNLRWLALERGLTESSDGMVFFVESKKSNLSGYPEVAKVAFPTKDVYFFPL